jgi:hypothetical protein
MFFLLSGRTRVPLDPDGTTVAMQGREETRAKIAVGKTLEAAVSAEGLQAYESLEKGFGLFPRVDPVGIDGDFGLDKLAFHFFG